MVELLRWPLQATLSGGGSLVFRGSRLQFQSYWFKYQRVWNQAPFLLNLSLWCGKGLDFGLRVLPTTKTSSLSWLLRSCFSICKTRIQVPTRLSLCLLGTIPDTQLGVQETAVGMVVNFSLFVLTTGVMISWQVAPMSSVTNDLSSKVYGVIPYVHIIYCIILGQVTWLLSTSVLISNKRVIILPYSQRLRIHKLTSHKRVMPNQERDIPGVYTAQGLKPSRSYLDV